MNKSEKLILETLKRVIEPTLAKQLLAEYRTLEESFSTMKWKYSELDGGRFCEVVARLIYSVDSGNISHSKSVGDCIKYIQNEKVPHNFPERKAALLAARVIQTTYKLRSQRGAVHVSTVYTADEIDSRLIIENCRWLMIELMRLFWDSDKTKVVGIIKEMCRLQIPIIRDFDGRLLVQRTDFTAGEEILALLFSKHAEGMTLAELISFIPKHHNTVRDAAKKLTSSSIRMAVVVSGRYKITDLGIKAVELLLAEKGVV